MQGYRPAMREAGLPETKSRKQRVMTMAKKRGQNEGSIFERKDGRWCGILNLGWENGRRIRKHLYGATAAEVQDKLLRARSDHSRGLPVTVERQRLAH